MGLCTRIPPPPVPPWLLDGTREFRSLLANCSAWIRYTESCPMQVPAEYIQPVAAEVSAAWPHHHHVISNTGTQVNQWLAVIITSLLVTCIVLAVCIVYYLYKTNRMTLDFLDDCHQNGCKCQKPRNKRYIALSVSEITQLSMETDNPWGITSPQETIHKLVKKRSKRHRKSSPATLSLPMPSLYHASEEVMLLPERLMIDNIQSPPYTSSLSESEYCSSHSLPIDVDNQKFGSSIKHQSETFGSFYGLDDDNYVMYFGNGEANTAKHGYLRKIGKHCDFVNSSYNKIIEARMVIQRCKKVGVSFIGRVNWRRNSDPLSIRSRHSFVKLRQSINKIRPQRQQYLNRHRNTEVRKSNLEFQQSTSFESDSEQFPSTSSDSSESIDSRYRYVDYGTQDISDKRFVDDWLPKIRLSSIREQIDRYRQRKRAPTLRYANEPYDIQQGFGARLKNLSLRNVRIPRVLARINTGYFRRSSP